MEFPFDNPLLNSAIGSIGDYGVFFLEEEERRKTILADPHYAQWVKEAEAYEADLRARQEQEREAYLNNLPNAVSCLERYLFEAINILKDDSIPDLEERIKRSIAHLDDNDDVRTEMLEQYGEE